MTANGFTDQGAYAPDNLIAGEYPRIQRVVTIATPAALTKGAVLGKITASGKYTLSASAASDGSEVPDAILAEDADATDADVQAVAYFAGEFNEDALTLGAGHTVAGIRAGLRDKNIYLRKNQGA
jgi:hypothetical protein